MSPINGKFREQEVLPSPSIKAVVEIPELKVSAPVEFLVDTGATRTTLHPGDVVKWGIDIASYAASVQPSTLAGIGGEASYCAADAVLRFKSTQIPLPVLIGPLDQSQFDLALRKQVPSLLGRDLLNLGRLVVDYETNQVSIEMHPTDRVNRTNLLRSQRSRVEFLRYRQRMKTQGSRSS